MKIKNIIISAALGALGVLAVITLRATPTIPQTQSVLNSYFTTGSVPTQDQYQELIGTLFYYSAVAASNAQLAATSAAASAANAAANVTNIIPASANFHVNNTTVTLQSSVNIAAITASHGGADGTGNYAYTLTCTFSNNFPTTNYQVYLPIAIDSVDDFNVLAVTRQSSNFVCQVKFPATTFDYGVLVK